jgi:hypothetical protein
MASSAYVIVPLANVAIIINTIFLSWKESPLTKPTESFLNKLLAVLRNSNNRISSELYLVSHISTPFILWNVDTS